MFGKFQNKIPKFKENLAIHKIRIEVIVVK